ncbi:MAG: O-antigen ligase family protein [Candidatus Omnitrophica bacterium]|nr:O-antigen ligase family protein [Candidatus Omnitrophota bacterium]
MNYQDKMLSKKVSSLGLILIGLFSIGYCLFSAYFAELHISFPFLDFPVFVGEFLLFLCVILLLKKWEIEHPKFNIWHYLLFSYFGFVLIKALWGYFKLGPLAFRHAALFYYPLFAIFSYAFYKRDFFDNKKKLFLALLIIFIFKFIPFYNYFLLTYFILSFVLIKTYPHKIVKYILFSLLLIVTPYMLFFHTSRTFLVSNMVAGIYIAIVLFFISRIKRRYRLILFVLLMLFIAIGVLKISDRNAVKSMITFRKLRNLYNGYNEFIMEKKSEFKMEEFKEVKLYHPEVKRIATLKEEATSPEAKRIATLKEEATSPEAKRIATLKEEAKLVKPSLRSLETAYNNIFFRIFIWRDILMQLIEERPLLGFDFGKPLRSKRIEILGWAKGDWVRDGWITAHNSYLHIIYRTGIIGVLFIGAVLAVFVKMVLTSIKRRSITGVLLCGALLSWLIAANFLVIFELPYNAIPFWSLFGMTFAYLWKKNKADENINNPQPLA